MSSLKWRGAGLVTAAGWLLPSLARADSGAANAAASSSSLPGVLAGLILLALLGYALWTYAEPLIRQRDRAFGGVLLGLLVLWGFKTLALGVFSGYALDLGTYEAWAMRLTSVGPAQMYTPGYFLDYPPGYLYVLWFAGWLAKLFGASGSIFRIFVETPALAADFLLAAAAYIFFRRQNQPRAALISALLIALNPALLFDTVGWGQSDSVLTLAMFLSVLMMLESEYELGWSLAALSLLIKPQAACLLPVLGLWTLLHADWRQWWRAALAGIAVMVIGVAPFQVGHPLSWLPHLYLTTMGYYHETSLNAFNLMALIGGIRQNDSGTLLGISYFTIGIAMLVPLYAFITYVMWRNPSRRNLIFLSFLALFGFFLLAPRIHERYIYPAIVFAVPLAAAEPEMLAIYGLLTVTTLINLADALYILSHNIFLDARDALAMTVSAVNVIIFALAIIFGYQRTLVTETGEEAGQALAIERWLRMKFTTPGIGSGPRPIAPRIMLNWRRIDTIMIAALTVLAAALRFWHLGHPAEIVFDEVHFVGQARHYLHGENFLDPHPPLAKLLIALGILIFGDHPWAWRLGVATIGTLMVPVTYMLGRRMFQSRLAAALAAIFLMTDGFFLVDSRIAVIDIVYLTFAAISYLLMFRVIQLSDRGAQRTTLIFLGIALGLCLGSKLYVPAVTFLLVLGFLIYALVHAQGLGFAAKRIATNPQIAGATMMIGALGAILYLACFIPHYALGWWGGISDLFHYYHDVMWYEKSVATATHPYASPWWSWPLMLRPVAYWQDFPPAGNVVSTIWGAGNPILWWGVIPAIAITAVRALERPTMERVFLVVGYLSYYVIWIPITRILFLYHYMPSIYLGYLALAWVLADFWIGEAEVWETGAVLLVLVPAAVVGIGHMAVTLQVAFIPQGLRELAGMPIVIGLAIGYLVTLGDMRRNGRFVTAAFLGVALLAFIYFLPVWLGTPISRSGYYARMWLEGPGLRNWI
ncbi:MAG TPA: phospholipid carrier-dependent glycosyltransferase [Candidatus Binataceae bacterium]|nr:phospholipid carrier-dependent glycosyltransferase [Candidatus Binataceae bacterium]